MEQRMKRFYITLTILAMTSMKSMAQYPTHDDQKEKQWKSMENGPWNFAPGWYYYFLHRKYSGAYLHWAWLGTSVRFKESKSDVKRIMPTRILSEETQYQKQMKAEEEQAYIEKLYREEVVRAADRNVDLVYPTFIDDFTRMQQSINEGLVYCLKKSKGKLRYQVNQLTRQNEVLCQNIEYIHKTGVGYELENAKRQEAYWDYKKDMELLVSRVAHLVGMAQNFYK